MKFQTLPLLLKKHQSNETVNIFSPWNFPKTIIETGEKSYQCKKCPEKFEIVAALKNHERFHFEEEPFQCNICLKSFWLKSYRAGCMKSHERIMRTNVSLNFDL